MEGGADGGAAAGATPPTAPPRGASRAVLLEQRKKEVQDVAVVGALVKVAYAEAWTTRAGAAMCHVFRLRQTSSQEEAVPHWGRRAEISRMGSTLPHAKPIIVT